jgi:hypothetical protein
MIPYEQLVSALTAWRQRHGLPTTAADVFGESPDSHANLHRFREDAAPIMDDALIDEDAILAEESRGFDDPEPTSMSTSTDYTAVEAYDDDDALLDALDGDEPKR